VAEKVGMGVVGAGSIGIRAALAHLSQQDVQDRVYLAAVCDPVPGRAEAAKERFGVVSAYERYEDLLADPAVDAITLCTPIGMHYAQALQAIEAGKHIHFNKTMTVESAEASDVIARAQARGLKLVASPGMMLWPHNQRARRAILEGRLGTLVWGAAGASGVAQYHLKEPVRQGNDLLSNIDPSWYFRRPGGGPQYDVTVYCLHNLTGILGPARRVTALSGLVIPEREYRGQRIHCDMDDSTVMLLDFGNAFYAFVYGTVTGKLTDGFQPSIFGTEGSIIGTQLGDIDLTLPGDLMPHHEGAHKTMEERHVFEDLMQLVDWIRDDKASIATAEHARHVIEIIEAGYRAAETGQTQDLTTTFDVLPLDQLAELPA
jgi:predicted dehydrogenase